MKPRTKLEKRVVALSETLKPVTEAQKRWAKKNCFDHNAYMEGGWLWCTECGKYWMDIDAKNGDKTVCPYCQAKLEVKKQWPELTDYSLLLNLYMCVILIDFVRRFERASSKVIQQATMNPYVAIENDNLLNIRKACIDIAGKYRLPNTDMIRLGVKILAMNIDKMVKVEYDKN